MAARSGLARLAGLAARSLAVVAPPPNPGHAASRFASPSTSGPAWALGRGGAPAAWNVAGRRWESTTVAGSGGQTPTPPPPPAAQSAPSSQPPPSVSAPLIDPSTGAVLGSVPLPADVFGLPLRRDLLHRVVVWQGAKARQGSGAAKNRAAVRGGGRKPWAQKGSGRARAGSTRSPLWVGGGKAHPPVPRSHAIGCNRRVRRVALATALSARAAEGRLFVADSLSGWGGGKAKSLAAGLAATLPPGARPSVLLADGGPDAADGGPDLRRAAANLPLAEVLPPGGLNVASILRRDALLMTRGAVEAVVERLRRPIAR
jgi:50S ribosomal protein L4